MEDTSKLRNKAITPEHAKDEDENHDFDVVSTQPGPPSTDGVGGTVVNQPSHHHVHHEKKKVEGVEATATAGSFGFMSTNAEVEKK